MANFVIKDNSAIVLQMIAGNIRDAMDEAAQIAVDAVQEKILYGYHDVHGPVPHTEIVDTGKLFDSIQGKVSRESQNLVEAQVGTDVKYAKYVHDGTYKLKGRPFIKDGLNEATPQIKSAIESNVRKGF